jgi:hypothetical protein
MRTFLVATILILGPSLGFTQVLSEFVGQNIRTKTVQDGLGTSYRKIIVDAEATARNILKNVNDPQSASYKFLVEQYGDSDARSMAEQIQQVGADRIKGIIQDINSITRLFSGGHTRNFFDTVTIDSSEAAEHIASSLQSLFLPKPKSCLNP